MTTLEMLQKTINIQQGKEKPVDEQFNDIFVNYKDDDKSVEDLKKMFGMK